MKTLITWNTTSLSLASLMNLHQGLGEKRRLGILFGVISLLSHRFFSCIIIVDGKVCLAGNVCVQFRAAQWCVANTFTCLFKCTLRACIAQFTVYCLSVGLCKSSKMFLIIRKYFLLQGVDKKTLILFVFCWWPWILFSECFQITAFSTDVI